MRDGLQWSLRGTHHSRDVVRSESRAIQKLKSSVLNVQIADEPLKEDFSGGPRPQ